MKKTKIICTLGPATDNPQILEKMILSGMNVARFNFSHGAYEDHEKRLKEVIAVREKLNAPVATLLDTKGPEVRLGDFENPDGVTINEGDKFVLTTKECLGTEKKSFVNYEGLPRDVKPGTVILINDGLISMKVDCVKGSDIHCTVIDGGLLTNHKGVNVPGVDLNMPYLSERDMNDLKFGAAHDFDFIAASFIRSATDVTILRNFVDAIGWKDVKIISKIENVQGVNNIDSIIAASDGIMVARGDLGIEISTEKVPIVQKTIIRKSNVKRKVVIVATQMLESMIENPIPTRAETSDVANAILDGTDAIMLSGETAAGAYPVEAVSMMKKIADTVEHSPFMRRNKFPWKMTEEEKDNQAMAIGMSIADMSKKMPIKAVVALTASGFTAKFLSEGKLSVPIFACCPKKKVCRYIKLYRGVNPVAIDFDGKIDRPALQKIDEFLTAQLCFNNGDTVILTGSVPELLVGGTNFIKIHVIGSAN